MEEDQEELKLFEKVLFIIVFLLTIIVCYLWGKLLKKIKGGRPLTFDGGK